jgi:hypothetical protein
VKKNEQFKESTLKYIQVNFSKEELFASGTVEIPDDKLLLWFPVENFSLEIFSLK